MSKYHIIYNSLRNIYIETDEIEPIHLSNFVQDFRAINDNNLKNLCDIIQDLYESQNCSELKTNSSCKDWGLLAEQLRDLDETQRDTLCKFLSCLPSTFNRLCSGE